MAQIFQMITIISVIIFHQGKTLFSYNSQHFIYFINELITELKSLDNGIDITDRNIFLLLYSDDFVVFADTEVNHQRLLNKIYHENNENY